MTNEPMAGESEGRNQGKIKPTFIDSHTGIFNIQKI
jgi:hypothetical protein